MSFALRIQKMDEISMLLEKYKTVILNMIILLKSASSMNRDKLSLDIQTIRCISLAFQSIYSSHEKLILLFGREEEMMDYGIEYINTTVNRFCNMLFDLL